MTLITFEDGKPLMKDDGKIGTEQECCCGQCEACPENLYELCWSVTVTDFQGNTQTKTQDDFRDFPFFIPIIDFVLPVTGITLEIRFDCVEGEGIYIEPGGGGRNADGCFGTPDPALFLIPCTSEEGWWLGTTIGNAIVHNAVESPGCPQPVATFSVTISEPPC
jgi:hypothetical protein